MNGDRSQVLEGSNLGESEADPVGTVYLANTTASVAFPKLSIPTREQVSAPTFCVSPSGWLTCACSPVEQYQPRGPMPLDSPCLRVVGEGL